MSDGLFGIEPRNIRLKTCTDCGSDLQWRFCDGYCKRCCNKAHQYGCSDVTIEREKLHALLGDAEAEKLIKACEVYR